MFRLETLTEEEPQTIHRDISASLRERVVANVDSKATADLLMDMIRIPSVNPAPAFAPRLPVEENNEREIARYLEKVMRELGMETEVLAAQEYRENVIGRIKGRQRIQGLVLNAHIDTAPVGHMEDDAFEAKVRHGAIFGRGAVDDKGPLAAMVMAAAAIVRTDVQLEKDLVVLGAADEEAGGELGTGYMVRRGLVADNAIVGEATNLGIAIAGKGVIFFEIDVKGKSAHISTPDSGINAVAGAAKLAVRLEEFDHSLRSRYHELLGSPTLSIASIAGGLEDPSKVPDECVIKMRRGLIPGETKQDSIDEVQEIVDQLKRTVPGFQAEIDMSGAMAIDPFHTAPDERIVNVSREQSRYLAGKDPGYCGVPYGCDASYYGAKSIPTVVCGPGDISLGHSSSEYIEIEQLVTAARLYALIILGICGAPT